MMARTLLGPEVEVFVRGSFSTEELAYLQQFCRIVLPPAAEPTDDIGRMIDAFDGLARFGAITMLGSYLSAPHNASAIDPTLRLLAYFSRHDGGPVCAASARPVPRMPPETPTYLIALHAEGVAILRRRVSEVARALRDGKSCVPLDPFPRVLDLRVSEREASMMTVLFVFLHEVGHVVGGHLDWNPPLHAPCSSLSTEARMVRRTLEVHADILAAGILGSFLKGYAARDQDHEEADRPWVWLVLGLLAAYAVFTTLSEVAEQQATACYHSPYVRLLNASRWIAHGMGIDHRAGERAVAAIFDRLFGTDESKRARDHGIGGGASDLTGADSREFDCVTMPMLQALQEAGRLRGRVATLHG